MKDHEGPAPSAGLVQMQHLALLVWQHHIWKACSDGWTDNTKVNTEIRDCSHVSSSLGRTYRARAHSIAR
jgi:hypothetical protein